MATPDRPIDSWIRVFARLVVGVALLQVLGFVLLPVLIGLAN